MIIWLASYPRSGNTLLRTIIRQTMDSPSFSDEPLQANISFSDNTRDAFGDLPITEPWEVFYEKASNSKETFFVKTHLPPRDNQPVIYILRDGRAALSSYLKYHQNFSMDYIGNIYDLVLGNDYYGGWSEHFSNWASNERKIMYLRYEEIVHPSQETLESIAMFVGKQKFKTQWTNSFNQLHSDNPSFFREGNVNWVENADWNWLVNQLFFLMHGELMVKFNYVDQKYVKEILSSISHEVIEFSHSTMAILNQKRYYEQVSSERLQVINNHVVNTKKSFLKMLFKKTSLKWTLPWER